jgi:hypothetical protein
VIQIESDLRYLGLGVQAQHPVVGDDGAVAAFGFVDQGFVSVGAGVQEQEFFSLYQSFNAAALVDLVRRLASAKMVPEVLGGNCAVAEPSDAVRADVSYPGLVTKADMSDTGNSG